MSKSQGSVWLHFFLVTDQEARGVLTKRMFRRLINKYRFLSSSRHFHNVASPMSHVNRSKGSAKHPHPQQKALKLVNVPHEDVQRHFDEMLSILSCDEILMPPNLSHMDLPDPPAAIH